ncbi:YitT family protein [Pollutibacter soli]|uniref:YitT family protein n=1 Tax=Pollutibacter soli TaxID=3034157 RepID=UPI003013BDBF
MDGEKNLYRRLFRNKYPIGPEGDSKYLAAKNAFQLRVFLQASIKDIFFLTCGFLAAGFGLKGFLLPAKFIDGGATGISLILDNVTGIPVSIFLIVINLPFLYMGFRSLGWSFFIKAAFAIAGLAAAVAFIPYPEITKDKLLVAVFGGFFLGAGIGLAVRGGGVLDGTEILAIFVSRRTTMTIGDIIMIINFFIFLSAAYILGVENALYSMLTYLAASKTVDFIIEGIEEYTGVTIISPKSHEIAEMITKKMGRGITVYKGTSGFGKRGYVTEDIEIIFTVITRLEISRLQTEIMVIDPNAFVVRQSIKDTKGGMIKKRPLHD